MSDNVLRPLSGFHLSGDFPWRVGFITLVDQELRRLRRQGISYRRGASVVIFAATCRSRSVGSWTMSLDPVPPMTLLPEVVGKFTQGEYTIGGQSFELTPGYMLVLGTRNGACWLWSVAKGRRFIEANEPVLGGDGLDDAENTKLPGP